VIKLRIQTSLAIFFLIIIALSLPVFLLLTLHFTTGMIDRQVTGQLITEAAESVELLKLILKPVESDLIRLSEEYSLQEYLRLQNRDLETEPLSEDQRQQLEDDLEIAIRGAKDAFRRLLGDQAAASPYERVAFIDPGQTIRLEETRGEAEALRQSVHPLFEKAIEMERGSVLIEDKVLSDGLLRFAAPVIRDENIGMEDSEAMIEPLRALFGEPVRAQEGVIILDYRFSDLRQRLLETRIMGSEEGSLFLADAKGRLLAARANSVAVLKSFLPAWNAGMYGSSLVYKYEYGERIYLISLWPYAKRGWYVGVIAPQDDFTAPLSSVSRNLILASFLLFAVALLVAMAFIRRVSEPLRAFVSVAQQIARGQFGARVRASGGREIDELASAFNNMAGKLQGYLEEVRLKEQMEQELKVAHKIQTGLQPRRLPEVEGVLLDARTIPAQEVGGDYIDFLPMTGQQLAVVVGDVTGRGVPAALLMTMTRSIVRSQFGMGTPGEVLQRTNRIICQDVRESRHSVALFLGVYQAEKRLLHFSNAGQMYPLIYRKRENAWSYLEMSGVPLGIRPEEKYGTESVRLEAWDRVVLFTDGVVEALDNQGSMFGFERFEKLVEQTGRFSPAEQIQEILEQLKAFTQRLEPEDDVTLAVIEITGAESDKS
jgi:serine phosphatase RsbU (regulator of sigma subunit)